MSNYICPECGANYIDCGHNNPAVLAQDLEITKLKDLLKECQGSIATLLAKRITEVNGIKQKELLAKINQVLGDKTDE